MAKMEYGWLKIRFGAQKYKKVIIALLCGFGLMALIYYGVRGMIPQMSVEEGSFSALLGALVGGFFSLAGSIGVAKMQQKSQREILKKNTIYKPLYDELMKNDDILRGENPFPMEVWCDTNPRTIVESPSFAAWNRIQRDNRLLDVPESIQTQMNDLEKTIERYLRLRRGVGTPVQKICYETLKAQGKETVLFTNIGDMVSDAVLNTDINGVLEYITEYNNKAEDDKKIAQEIYNACLETEDIRKIKELQKKWRDMQNDILDELAMRIKYISMKYEG